MMQKLGSETPIPAAAQNTVYRKRPKWYNMKGTRKSIIALIFCCALQRLTVQGIVIKASCQQCRSGIWKLGNIKKFMVVCAYELAYLHVNYCTSMRVGNRVSWCKCKHFSLLLLQNDLLQAQPLLSEWCVSALVGTDMSTVVKLLFLLLLLFFK